MKNKVLSDAFGWLFIGLLICFGVSYVTTISDEMVSLVYGCLNGWGYLVFLAAELIVAFVLVLRITKLSPGMAKILYILYTALTGLSLTGIFAVYTASSLAFVFLATAVIFGTFAIIGKTTKLDLSKWGVYLLVALFAIIILEIINIFVKSESFNIVICIVSVLIFSAYTAYDVQKALDKSFLVNVENKGIYCAFQLFLDFINLFLDLLRLFGKTND